MTPHPDYEDEGPLRLTESQEQSGVMAGYCFIALFCIGAWAGIAALIAWAFGI